MKPRILLSWKPAPDAFSWRGNGCCGVSSTSLFFHILPAPGRGGFMPPSTASGSREPEASPRGWGGVEDLDLEKALPVAIATLHPNRFCAKMLYV